MSFKSILVVVPVLLAVLTLSAQKAREQRVIISKNIEYNVSICSFQKEGYSPNFASRSWFRDNIEASDRVAFTDILVEKLMDRSLKVSDTMGNLLNADQTNALLIINDTVILTRVSPPYDDYDSILLVPLLTADKIMNLRFREEWTYDPKDLSIQKKVLAMSPLITEYNYDFEIGKDVYTTARPQFWIIFAENDDLAVSQVLTQRIVYGVDYKRDIETGTMNADSIQIDAYFAELFNRIGSGKMQAYDSEKSEMADHPIDSAGFREIMDMLDGPSDIVSNIRFLEEWYFDPNTMTITKKIVGVCPVSLAYDENFEFRGWRILFWSYFAPVWMPFNHTMELKK